MEDLTADPEGELKWRVDELDEGDRVVEDFLGQDCHRRVGDKLSGPMILQDNFLSLDLRTVDSVEAAV